jgi:hypothetical protein
MRIRIRNTGNDAKGRNLYSYDLFNIQPSEQLKKVRAEPESSKCLHSEVARHKCCSRRFKKLKREQN